MQHLTYPNMPSTAHLVATIGAFDGVHLGHRALIERIHIRMRESANNALSSALITFEPHPQQVLSPTQSVLLLCTWEEKKALLERLGLDYVVVLRFDEKMARMTKSDFLDLVIDRIGVRHLIVGENHRFGAERAGSFTDIQQRITPQFKADKVARVRYLGEYISSTRIRTKLAQGDMLQANAMLGYAYSFGGEVIRGEGLGAKIGFATANLRVVKNKLLPRAGVYAVRVAIAHTAWGSYKKIYDGMLYIGKKSIKNSAHSTVMVQEVHIFKWGDAALYGKWLWVWPIRFIRDARQMENTAELVQWLHKDKLASQRDLNESR